MSKKIKFKVSDKLVKQRDGASYSLSNYTEGVDYVMRGCFKGQKAVFREDILGVSVVDPSLVEHKQEPLPPDSPVFIPPFERVTLEVDEKGMRISWPEKANIAEPKNTREVLEEAGHTVVKSPLKWSDELNSWVNSQPESTEPSTEEWRPATPECKKIEQQPTSFDGLIPEHCPIQECKIKKIYNNFKWVETDKGRVWVGLKGSTMRVGQVIRVKNGELFLGKTAPSSPFVRI